VVGAGGGPEEVREGVETGVGLEEKLLSRRVREIGEDDTGGGAGAPFRLAAPEERSCEIKEMGVVIDPSCDAESGEKGAAGGMEPTFGVLIWVGKD